jgi:cell division protein FtsI/penicillin-binding protein 2
MTGIFSMEETMRTKSQVISAVVVAVLITLFTTGSAVAQRSKAKAKARERNIDITTLTLTISKDGRSIVDQNGKIVARFVNGMRVQMAPNGDISESQTMQSASSGSEKRKDVKAESQQMKGCLRCHDECLIYDKDGRCVKWYRSCTWDFDCK